MYSVDLTGITYAYSDAVPLLRDVSLHLVPGWTAVVGPNGAGKTTLLRLLARALEPDAGAIRFHPDGLAVRLCAQSVERLEPELRAFAESDDGAARELRGRLALDPAELGRWPTLSPGERKRWQVGAALAAEPGLLLLDEPTNHLDAEARELLAGALERYRGIGLVVSHDRALLNALASSTLRFHQGSVTSYPGGYDEARRTWQALEREKREAHAHIRNEQRKLERRLGDRRNRRQQAEAKMSTSRRMKNPHDSDARGRFKQTRRRSAMVALGREIELVHGRLDRLSEREREFSFEKVKGSSLFVDWVRAPLPRLLSLDASAIRAGDRVLLEDVHVEVGRETRVRLAGANGSGKTTLLNHLIAASRLPPSKLLYLPQELGEAESLELLAQARALDAAERGRLMSLVAALGVDPESLLESARPSPGEARKLALAMGLARQVWVALLDEPTNHLDLPSIERLEDALAAYPGALVVVTHDDAFARRLTSDVWLIRQGRVERPAQAD